MNTKITPGPWAVVGLKQDGSGWNGGNKDFPCAVSYKVTDDDRVVATEAEFMATAVLIEAAPELLAALKDALNVMAGVATGDLKTIKPDSPAIARARAAIDKAEGN